MRFDIVVTHDAEDLIHPESLRLINWFSREYEMVQMPVLPLPTGLRELTHGLYCDEFAEYQHKDIPVRQLLGGFLPSNGVGTGFDRGALDRLAADRGGQVFDPACLTEDYENGYRLHALGCRQIFVPLRFDSTALAGHPRVFPPDFPPGGSPAQPLGSRHRAARLAAPRMARSPPPTLLVLARPQGPGRKPAGSVRQLSAAGRHHPQESPTCRRGRWRSVASISASPCFRRPCAPHTPPAFTAGGSPRVSPSASSGGTSVNFCATVEAVRQFAAARWQGRRLDWRKTEHVYPPGHSAAYGRRRLGEILVHLRCISTGELEMAAEGCPPDMRIGEYLVLNQQS